MDDRIKPDFSIGIDFGDQHFLIDRVYDHVHTFAWLGYGLLKIITQEGVMQMSCWQSDAEEIAEQAGIIPIRREEISVAEYKLYGKFVIFALDDDAVGE